MNPPAEFHNTIYLHGPHRPVVRQSDPGVAVVTSGASILIRTRAEADALIAAFEDARMLLLDQPGGVS